MPKLISVIIAVWILAASAYSQVDQVSDSETAVERKLSITPFVGITNPTGDFKNTTSAHAGFATPGPSFGVDATVRFNDLFEFGGGLLININSLDQAAFEKQLRAASHTNFKSVDTGSWGAILGMLKGGIAPKVSKNLHPFFDVYLGLGFVGADDYDVVWEGSGPFSQTEAVPIGAGMGFVYGVGSGVTLFQHFTVNITYLNGSARLTPEQDGHTYESAAFTQHLGYFGGTLGYTFPIN